MNGKCEVWIVGVCQNLSQMAAKISALHHGTVVHRKPVRAGS